MDLVEIIGKLGPSALLAGALVSVVYGWVVPKYAYVEAKADRDFWRNAYVEQAKLSNRLTNVATQAVERVS